MPHFLGAVTPDRWRNLEKSSLTERDRWAEMWDIRELDDLRVADFIRRAWLPAFSIRHGVMFEDGHEGVVDAAVHLAKDFVLDTELPGSAIALLESVAIRLATRGIEATDQGAALRGPRIAQQSVRRKRPDAISGREGKCLSNATRYSNKSYK